jgi:hypothetical protein
LRVHDTLALEIVEAERVLLREALGRPAVRRLMTVPGVGAITALKLVSVIGDVSRFPSTRHLVGYLGLDPCVRQSGERPARLGHISRQGQAHARGLVVEAVHSAIRTPGPLRTFYHRVRTRRGTQVALVATARKLAALCWQLITRGEDYRYQAPSLTARKSHTMQRKVGDDDARSPFGADRIRKLRERILLEQAERDYRAHVASRAVRSAPHPGRPPA